MWIETINDRLYAVERFRDEITGRDVRIRLRIDRNTTQTRKKAAADLHAKWEERRGAVSGLRLSEVIARYFDACKDRKKEQTIIRDRQAMQKVTEIIGDGYVDKFTATYIESKLRQSGKPAVTLNGYIKILKIVIRWAYRKELTDNVQCVDRLDKFADIPKKEKIKDKFLELEEAEALIAGMTVESWQLLTRFLLLTGMRIGEAIALNVQDVDLEHRAISINKTWSQTLNAMSTPKTRSSVRELHIQPELLVLCRQINSYRLHTQLMNGGCDRDIFLPDRYGCRIGYDPYEKYLRENSERILGRRITAHVLRHTYTSVYAAKGISLDAISRALGHESSRITREIYLHVTAEQRQKDAEAMDSVRLFS